VPQEIMDAGNGQTELVLGRLAEIGKE